MTGGGGGRDTDVLSDRGIRLSNEWERTSSAARRAAESKSPTGKNDLSKWKRRGASESTWRHERYFEGVAGIGAKKSSSKAALWPPDGFEFVNG